MTLLETDLDDAPAPQGLLTLKLLASRQDTNLYGDISGGWLVNHMDQAAELAAGREGRRAYCDSGHRIDGFLKPCARGLHGECLYSCTGNWPQLS